MGILSLVLAAASIVGSWAYSGGATSCGQAGHGTNKSPMPADWTLSLIDTSTSATVTQWTAGKTYTVQLSAASTAFKGWSWAPVKGTPSSFPTSASSIAGSFAAGDSQSHSNTGCVGSITQTNGGSTHTLIKATWTPPVAGTGTVSLWALVVISKNGNNYNAVQTVTEMVAGASPSAVASPSATKAAVTATRTHTVAASASRGASTSSTSTSAATASSTPAIVPTTTSTDTATATATATVTVTATPSAGAVAVAAVESRAPVVVVNAAAPTPSTTNVAGIAIGSGLAGAAIVGVVAVVIVVMNRKQKKPFQFTPTVIVNSPVSQNDDSNPYMVSVSRTKMTFNATQAHI